MSSTTMPSSLCHFLNPFENTRSLLIIYCSRSSPFKTHLVNYTLRITTTLYEYVKINSSSIQLLHLSLLHKFCLSHTETSCKVWPTCNCCDQNPFLITVGSLWPLPLVLLSLREPMPLCALQNELLHVFLISSTLLQHLTPPDMPLQ